MSKIVPTAGANWPPRLTDLNNQLMARGGLTASEWDTFDDLLKKHDPVANERRWSEARRKNRLKAARELSIDDLRMVLAEKEAALTTGERTS